MNDKKNTIALEEYANNLDKYTRPLDEIMKENGDWDELVRVMNALAKL